MKTERLTYRSSDGVAHSKLLEFQDAVCNFLEKLAEYEDQEEQGSLIHLPCPIGGTVYVVHSICPSCMRYIECSFCDECIKNKYDIREEHFDLSYLDPFGRLYQSVFATRSAAENYIKELNQLKDDLVKKHGFVQEKIHQEINDVNKEIERDF